MQITKALIIAAPWIGRLLDGSKTWEMRSTAASHRGWFGLIRKSSGAVYGVARLVEVGAPLSPAEMIETYKYHRIPASMVWSGEVAKWNTPWKLADIQRFDTPIPYQHKSGAVTWVELDPEAVAAIAVQVGSPSAPLIPERSPISPPNDAPRQIIARHTVVVTVSAPAPTPMLTPAVAALSSGNVIGHVELTQGNIDHSHIYLRSFFDRFPSDAIGGSNRHEKAARDVMVDWGGPSPVQTDLDGAKRFFRARGWVKGFFENNSAAAGDMVVVEEIRPYNYRVSLRKLDQS